MNPGSGTWLRKPGEEQADARPGRKEGNYRDFAQTSKKTTGGIEHGAQNNVAGGVCNSPGEGQGVLIVLTKTRDNWSRRMEAGAPFQAFSQNGGELLRFQLVAV